MASCVAWPEATYSASVVDLATEACFVLHQLTVELATLKTYPEVDRMSLK